MRRALLSLSVLITTLHGAGCGGVDVDPGATAARATWHEDVAPIVHARCTGCHRQGGIAPFSLETYADAAATSGLLVTAVEGGTMPPWGAVSTDDCATRFGWQGDPRLVPAEIDTLRAWHEDGAQEGDPSKAAPLPDPLDGDLEGVTQTLEPAAPYTASGTKDIQRCFLLDPAIAAPTWLTGLQVVPGNLEVVHHAVVLVVPPESVPEIVAEAGPSGAFDCFGGVGASGLYDIGVWVPGARPFETPAGTGIPIDPGSRVLMNIHYHPTGYDHAPDLTRVALRTTAEAPPKNFIIITDFGNASSPPELQPGPNDLGGVEFHIPADVAGHTETMVFPIAGDNAQRYAMTAMFPHMHYVGVDLEARIQRTNPAPGEPAEECLMKVPRWDFDWQRTYFYDAPNEALPTIGGGDTLTLRCTYDNTTANPFVGRMISEENLPGPVDVNLGEQTTDEMCLMYMGVIY